MSLHPADWLATAATVFLPPEGEGRSAVLWPQPLRSRPPVHLWLLFPLLPITLLLLITALSEGDPPYFHYTTVSWEQVLPRPAEYTSLPAYDATLGFNWYEGGWDRRGRYFASYAGDRPYWPKGDPGLGPRNPLPTHIARYRILGIPQWTPMVFLLVLWAAWLVPFTRHQNQLPRGGKGFDPLARPCAATAPIAPAKTPSGG